MHSTTFTIFDSGIFYSSGSRYDGPCVIWNTGQETYEENKNLAFSIYEGGEILVIDKENNDIRTL